MIIHVAVVTVVHGAPEAEVESLMSALRELHTPGMASIQVHRDLHLRSPTSKVIAIAEFESTDAYLEFSSHDDHVALVAEHRHLLAEVSAAQFAR